MQKYARIRQLADVPKGRRAPTKTQLGQAATALAAALGKERSQGSFRVGIIDRGRYSAIDIEHGGGSAKVNKKPQGRPTCEIRASSRTLGEIAAGRLSPVDAYLQGRLRFRGDLAYAKRVYARTAEKGNKDF